MFNYHPRRSSRSYAWIFNQPVRFTKKITARQPLLPSHIDTFARPMRSTRRALPAVLRVGRGGTECRLLSTTTAVSEHYVSPVSEIPTMAFQASLPRLPIPPLQETCVRLGDTLEPLERDLALVSGLDPNDVEQRVQLMRATVERFSSLEGVALNEELVAVDENNPNTSFIAPLWFDMYLRGRYSLPINSNPWIPFRPDSRCAQAANPQVARAAQMIMSSLRFYRSLKDGKLSPDAIHARENRGKFAEWVASAVKYAPKSLATSVAMKGGSMPLDMSQYSSLFSSTRIPGLEIDELRSFSDSKHVVVIRNGRCFKLDVLDIDSGVPRPLEVIRDELAFIQQNSPIEPGAGVGVLTADERHSWCDVRKELAVNPSNAASLECIDSALFIVCLDTTTPVDRTDMGKMLLHSDGRSRWFDKSFSLVVFPDGNCGLNFEHSWGDGVAVLRYMTDIFFDSSRHSSDSVAFAPPQDDATVKELQWNISSSVAQAIARVGKDFDGVCSSLHTLHTVASDVGTEDLKELGLSPDGCAQMAFQLAYFKQTERTVSTYESASTASFRHGRTEVIRPVSISSRRLTQLFSDYSSATPAEKFEAMQGALSWHKNQAKNCKRGDGIDRHLFALQHMAKLNGWEGDRSPTLFNLESFRALQENTISTSTVASPAIHAGGFGPVSANGYGIGYLFGRDGLEMNVSSYVPGRLEEFCGLVNDGLRALRDCARENR